MFGYIKAQTSSGGLILVHFERGTTVVSESYEVPEKEFGAPRAVEDVFFLPGGPETFKASIDSQSADIAFHGERQNLCFYELKGLSVWTWLLTASFFTAPLAVTAAHILKTTEKGDEENRQKGGSK